MSMPTTEATTQRRGRFPAMLKKKSSWTKLSLVRSSTTGNATTSTTRRSKKQQRGSIRRSMTCNDIQSLKTTTTATAESQQPERASLNTTSHGRPMRHRYPGARKAQEEAFDNLLKGMRIYDEQQQQQQQQQQQLARAA